MSLFDYKESKPMFTLGRQDLSVLSWKRGKYPTTNNPFLEISLTNGETKNDGSLKTIRKSFCLTAPALEAGFLARFAIACGFTDDDLRRWNERDGATDSLWRNRRVSVSLVMGAPSTKTGKSYVEIDEDSAQPATGAVSAPAPRPAAPAPAPAPCVPAMAGVPASDGEPLPEAPPDEEAQNLTW